ncbi:hypothetical protein BsWGS_02095 [Bradybaena similaris]
MASLLLMIFMFCAVAQGQVPTLVPVCSSVSSGATIPLIHLSDEFSVRVEVVAQETNRVISMRMFYSLPRNQIKLSVLDQGLRSDTYFYFEDNEILTFDYSVGRGNCTVIPDLANAADTFIVGGSKDNRIKDALGVLHFTGKSGFGNDEIQTTYLGVRSIRDMDVDAYYSCQKWSYGSQQAIVNVTHYFSNKTWSRPDPATVPISIEIHGSAVIHNKVASIDHVYNYFDFQPSVDATIFETPPGIMCQGRNVDVPFPNLASYIKFSGETIDGVKNDMSYFEEIYDSDDDFVVIRSQSELAYGTQGGMNEFTVIRDYVTGLSYTIDSSEQFCAIQNITAANRLPVDFINPQGKVQDVTPQQLFYADNAKYEYLGERNIRGILADTWVTRTNIPSFPNNEVTVEWYFAQSDVASWNDGSQYYIKGKYRMPVLMRVWLDDATLVSIDTNIYHVDYTKIMYGVLDIRGCYPDRPSNHFQLILQGAKELVMNTNIEQFKWSTATTLAKTAGVRWIRIADLQIYYAVGDAVIEFELLDAPPYASDISGPIFQSLSLQQAAQKLNNAVTSGSLYINVWDSVTQQISKPIQASFTVPVVTFKEFAAPLINNAPPPKEVDDNKYSAGAMAGLGIAMLIVGGAGGGVGAHFFFK